MLAFGRRGKERLEPTDETEEGFLFLQDKSDGRPDVFREGRIGETGAVLLGRGGVGSEFGPERGADGVVGRLLFLRRGSSKEGREGDFVWEEIADRLWVPAS